MGEGQGAVQAAMATAQGADWLVWAPGGARLAATDFAASAGLNAGITEERKRILDEHQGGYLSGDTSLPSLGRGPATFEALWLHTGFVAHLTFPSPGR